MGLSESKGWQGTETIFDALGNATVIKSARLRPLRLLLVCKGFASSSKGLYGFQGLYFVSFSG